MRLLAATLAVFLTLVAGCAGESGAPDAGDGVITVYSGRNKRLIGPLLDRFHRSTGIDVEIRYGGTSELTATLMEEGEHSPADLFISQDATALGALSAQGMLRPLTAAVLERVPAAFRSPEGDWVGLSGRARVVVYNTERMQPEDLPQSLEQVTDERYHGKFGIAPTNASYQAHMAMFYARNGEQALERLLHGIAANEPMRYPKNSPIVAAVISGEIDWGLVNHYYLWRALREDPDAPARNFFMPGGDASSFVNMAGAGLLNDDPQAAQLLAFLLSDEAQRYFAEETYEYPLVAGIAPSVELPAVDALIDDSTSYQQVAASLDRTLTLIDESGLLGFN